MALDLTTLIYEKDGPIAKITMNRPRQYNSWLPITTEEFRQAFTDVQKDDAIRVLIITGAGDKAFCSGEDVEIIRSGAAGKEAAAANKVLATPGPPSVEVRLLCSIVEKPVIAAVNGVTAGGGYGMALASDIRIASENAVFHHVYLRRGLVTSCEVWFLPRLIGLGPALQHILTRDKMDAQEAYRIGLVSKVVPQSELQAEARAMAELIAEGPPNAAKWTKKAILQGLMQDLTKTMEFVGWARAQNQPSGEVREGASAFLEKRKPSW